MTDEVAELVLADNSDQNELLGIGRANAASLLPVHARLIKDLVADRGLDRELEVLPSEKEIRRRTEAGHGLTSPELATLMAHVKLDLKDEVLATDLPDRRRSPRGCREYFPTRCASGSPPRSATHPLRREIVTTMLVNEIVDAAGITYAFRLIEEVGVGPADAVRAYVATDAIFRLERGVAADPRRRTCRRRYRTDDAGLAPAARPRRPLAAHQPAAAAGRRRGDQPVRQEGRRADAADAEWLRGDERGHRREGDRRSSPSHGVPEDLAYTVAAGLYQYSLLDIIDIADIVDREPAEVADTYFALMEHLGIDGLLTAVSAAAT